MNDFSSFWAALRLNTKKFVLVLIIILLAKLACQFWNAPVLIELTIQQPDLNGSATAILQYILFHKFWWLTVSLLLIARSLVKAPQPA